MKPWNKYALALVLLAAGRASAQIWDVVCPGGSTPSEVTTLSNGHLKAVSCVNSTGVITPTAAWNGSSSGSIPPGLIAMILSGTCPAGFSEATALNGKMLRGTLASNGDVGTTGGNATITPAGSVSAPIFTGTPITQVINHTHTVSVTDPGHAHTQAAHTHTLQVQGSTTASTSGTHAMTSTATGGSSRALASPEQANSATPTINSNTTGISASTANPAGGVSSVTPVGANSQPIFSGDAVDPSPPFTKVIFCSKD